MDHARDTECDTNGVIHPQVSHTMALGFNQASLDCVSSLSEVSPHSIGPHRFLNQNHRIYSIGTLKNMEYICRIRRLYEILAFVKKV